MREHRWRYRKYMILLKDEQPFESDEKVKIMSKNDFEDIRNMVEALREDKSYLKEQVKDLEMEIEEQKEFISYLKKISTDSETSKDGIKNLFKSLIT